MAAAEAKDEKVRLNYFQWKPEFDKVKPYELLVNVPDNFPTRNFTFNPGEVEIIHDMRGKEASFSLDRHGLCVRNDPLAITILDKQTVENQYLPGVDKLIRRVLEDVAEVFFFDWRLRTSDSKKVESSQEGEYLDLADQTKHLLPAEAVHIDQSPWSAHQRVRYHMKERANELLPRRFRIINIWRPTGHPVEDYPLAVCDASSLQGSRLIAADHIRRDYQGESYYPLYAPGYEWYYLSHQTPDEVLLFKTYDLNPSGEAVGCPHTSFKSPHASQAAMPRESIEVRALVFSGE
ncbi:hypothetical protein AJ79_07809 [Helicocarpus griseus UAMH5409]|uniref:Methyltransferase n=1 Tax=Helicocarpus griseus UAMH5409 TaxID=1447875 RepID=A0A2B7WZF5_9EURO|nr:hypothetical protein AJ79_07809 [Helicocarpus griseus UAMH5409]